MIYKSEQFYLVEKTYDEVVKSVLLPVLVKRVTITTRIVNREGDDPFRL